MGPYPKLVDQLTRAGRASHLMPFQLPPELPEYCSHYVEIFWLLSSDRTYGMSAGPIPWSTIQRYAEIHGYVHDDDLYDDLLYILAQMDQEYQEWYGKKQKKAQEEKDAQQKPPPQQDIRQKR